MSVPSGAKSVAIVGGGLAGLAAGCALAESGFLVTVFEKRPYVGGRASSYEHPGTGEVIDNCQHVLLGCCTNLIQLYEKLGVADQIRWYDDLSFVEPGGRITRLGPSALPAPFHSTPSFLRAPSLGLKDKIAIGRALMRMMPRLPADSDQNFLQWLTKHGQTESAIERFWKPVLISALSEDLDHVSVRYAAQVFRESFLKSARAGRFGVPTVPLTQLYSKAAEFIRTRGGEVVVRSSVTAIIPGQQKMAVVANGGTRQFDFAILSVPFQNAGALLPDDPPGAEIRKKLTKFQAVPITGVHLWLDREITPLPHAVLLDRTIQWLFQKSRFQKDRNVEGSYIELVVSASKSLVEKSREEVLQIAQRELTEFFPAARDAKVTKAAVVKEVYAAYSIAPGLDAYRPNARCGWDRLFLAGDWTATEWPATMEGAVRSGYLAAEAITQAAGTRSRFVAPDLKPAGLMKVFG